MGKDITLMKNEGFSLVELIIVIAIMAVLVGVFAPMYFMYIERSKKNIDVESAYSIVSAVKSLTYDHTITLIPGQEVRATMDSTKGVEFTTTKGLPEMEDKIVGMLKKIISEGVKLRYRSWNGEVVIVGIIDSNGELEIDCENTDFEQYAVGIPFKS